MPQRNSSLISSKQGIPLATKISVDVNGADLNWKGNNISSVDTFEKYGVSANINRVLFWLASKPDDYVRSSLKGGVLYSLIGQLQSDANLKDWEDQIKERFNAEFSQDLELFLLQLIPDKTYKKLTLHMIVKDFLLNKTFTVSTEVSK